MQKISSVLALQSSVAETEGKFVQDFWVKLKLMEESGKEEEEEEEEKAQSQQQQEFEECEAEEEEEEEEKENQDGEEEYEDDDDEDFTFSRAFGDDSLISAEDVFQNGQIRPVFPLFNRDLLFPYDISKPGNSTDALRSPMAKKLLVEEHGADEPEGPYCEWRGKAAVDASPEVCKKSNSTGFSKLWRFRELVLRSNSDGKDAFVFLNHHNHNHTTSKSKKAEKSQKGLDDKTTINTTTTTTKTKVVVKKSKKSSETASSAFEKIYGRRKKEEGKRMPYLPYKNVGFFTNVNGFSKNVHPY